jgi:hypothetical protein
MYIEVFIKIQTGVELCVFILGARVKGIVKLDATNDLLQLIQKTLLLTVGLE